VSATVDANLLLYASDEASGFHVRALELVEEVARGPGLLYLFWPVIMAYLRIATHPAIFHSPLSAEAAGANIGSLLDRPHVLSPGEEDGFWGTYRDVTDGLVVRGNLVSDAHLVALMRQYGVATIWSHDRDFRKFEGITALDPFA